MTTIKEKCEALIAAARRAKEVEDPGISDDEWMEAMRNFHRARQHGPEIAAAHLALEAVSEEMAVELRDLSRIAHLPHAAGPYDTCAVCAPERELLDRYRAIGGTP